jgi:hypothetical protein
MQRTILFFLTALLVTGCTEDAQRKDIADLIGQIGQLRLRSHVVSLTEAGPRPANDVQATRHAVDYIKAQLVSFGYQPFEESPGAAAAPNQDRAEFINIIILELGAHYDTVATSPGADDNASGVAAVLEVARVLSQATMKATVRFCFFAREESGRKGSLYHVQQIKWSAMPRTGRIPSAHQQESRGCSRRPPPAISWLWSATCVPADSAIDSKTRC